MKLERLFDLLPRYGQQFPKEDTFAFKENGKWVKYHSNKVIEIVNQVSLGFVKMGVGKGDKIAIISINRPEWNFIDFGAQQIGAITVPMYPTITEKDYSFIFKDAEVKLVFVANQDLNDKVKNATRDISGIEGIFSFDKLEGVSHWSEVKKKGEKEDLAMLGPYIENVANNDLLTLIYTSGTTGTPKGVMLTHNNILSNVIAVSKLAPLEDSTQCRALSFLPICHIFERTVIYFYLYSGISIYYAESMETIAGNLKEVKPHTFATVPRLLEKVYDKIVAKGYELSGIKKSLFFWALNLGLDYELNKNQGWWYDFQLKMANKVIFSKWREALGGNIIFIVSGAASLQPRLARVFWAAGIKVLEGYGLTETSPGICFSRAEPENARIGCVGPALDGVNVKIAADGEILVKGPNVMKGYYKRPDLTAEVMDEEGWFHTGDIGEMVDNRFLKITDRKKEIFKTSGGKYIAPQVIENKFKESVFIEQIMVAGENERFPAALIIPNEEALKNWCNMNKIKYSTLKEMVNHPEVKRKYESEIEKYNQNFAQFEQIKKFILLPGPWDIKSGELTPTLKLKRKAIHKKYESLISSFYA